MSITIVVVTVAMAAVTKLVFVRASTRKALVHRLTVVRPPRLTVAMDRGIPDFYGCRRGYRTRLELNFHVPNFDANMSLSYLIPSAR